MLPETRLVYQLMRRWKADLADQWAGGVFQKDTSEATAEANAAALGQIEILDRLLNLEAEQLEEALNPNEQEQRETDRT